MRWVRFAMADLVILASGSGSNFEALVNAVRHQGHRAIGLICDQPRAMVVQRSERLGVPVHMVNYGAGRELAENEVLALLRKLEPDVIALAGYMRILPAMIVREFRGRIVNIHPSLLPAYPGLHAIGRSYEAGAAMGITVHLVDEGVDTGPILAQQELHYDRDEPLETIEARVHDLEHALYPEVVLGLLRQNASKGQPA